MRKKARKILFEELEKSGWQWAIFNEDEPNKNNGIIECVLDAMEKFKNLHIHAVSSNEVAVCCPNCKYYPAEHDNYCNTCQKFSKFEAAN